MSDRNRAVMYVDQDSHSLRAVAEQLGQRDRDVISIDDPSIVLDRLIEGTCRVVLLGINAPGNSGLDLLRSIKQQDGALQVIVLTETVPISIALESMRLGAEACLFKPLSDIEPLCRAIDNAFEKIDHWWLAVSELSQRKLGAQPTTMANASCGSGVAERPLTRHRNGKATGGRHHE